MASNSLSSRSNSQIEADLGATRDRLTGSVQALIDQIHPNRIKQREIANVKRFAALELENLKALVFNARGDLRTERLAVLGGSAAGVTTFLLIIRAVLKRSRNARSAGASQSKSAVLGGS